jgi:hypothetical protein
VDASPTKAPRHPNLEVRVLEGRYHKTRKTFVVNGASPPVCFRAHNNGVVTLERAVNERVFYVSGPTGFVEPPRPQSGDFFNGRLRAFRAAMMDHLFTTTPVPYEQFVGMYRGRRQKVYQAAADSLLRGETISQLDAETRPFVKAEKVNFTAKSDPCPRVIQPRSPRYNVEVGRYLKPVEERIYEVITCVFGSKTVFKGMNALRQGTLMKKKWDRFRNPVAVGLDASRFDQHVSVSALQWEHSVYAMFFRNPRPLLRLLSWQLRNKATAYCGDGLISYVTEGCRMSGDMNTALGNCLLMCAMVWSYCKHKQVAAFELANNGDDCIVIMEASDLGRFSGGLDEWFREMGFTMKVEAPVSIFERIEFCQTRPVLGADGWRMIRIPQIAMAKDCISLTPVDTKVQYEGWMAAVGLGGLSLTGGIPVWQSFYRSFIRASNGAKPRVDDQHTGFKMLGEGLEPKARPITQESRFSFFLAFGVTPDMQVEIERHYDSLDLHFNLPRLGEEIVYIPDWM